MNIYTDLDNTVIDFLENLCDLSENIAEVKSSNDAQGLNIFSHGLQISANTNAISAAATLLGTTGVTTTANTRAIATILLTLGVPSAGGITPSTGIYGSIDSKTSRSLFGSGNVAVYGLGPLEYINLVYNNDYFEDIKLISNHALNLKEPCKSLPSVVDTISNNKQDKLTFITPLSKDISNNISIDLSAYVLNTNFDLSFNNLSNNKQNCFTCTEPLTENDISHNISIDLSGYAIGNIKGTKATLHGGYLDPLCNSLILYRHNPGSFFTDHGFNILFNLSSATVTNNNNLAIVPFITNYNRIFKNGINNAIKLCQLVCLIVMLIVQLI